MVSKRLCWCRDPRVPARAATDGAGTCGAKPAGALLWRMFGELAIGRHLDYQHFVIYNKHKDNSNKHDNNSRSNKNQLISFHISHLFSTQYQQKFMRALWQAVYVEAPSVLVKSDPPRRLAPPVRGFARHFTYDGVMGETSTQQARGRLGMLRGVPPGCPALR